MGVWAPSLNVGWAGMGCQSTPAKFVASAVFALAPSKWRQTSKSMGKHMVERVNGRVNVCVWVYVYGYIQYMLDRAHTVICGLSFVYEGFSINKPDFPKSTLVSRHCGQQYLHFECVHKSAAL